MTVLTAVLCLVAMAAGSAVVTPEHAANLQSTICSLKSADAITIPQMLSYQGKLTDTLGVPVADTTYSVAFRLYTQPSGGSALWSETQNVITRDGLFAVLLGSVTPIGSVPEAGALYLGMSVAGGAELVPRLRIASAAYAYLTARAANSDLLQGKDTTALDARYVNEAQANSVTSAMIVNGTIAAADLGQMGASSGQVMKWTGSAWAPRNDSIGSSGSGTVRKVVQAAGVVCSPNPITDSGTVRFDSTYGDGRYIRNQSSTGQNANFRITGTGQAAQFHGIASTAGKAGILGEGGTLAYGVFGRCSTSSYAAVYGYGTTTSNGVEGYTSTSNRFGMRASNGHSSGTGIAAAGNGSPVWYLTPGSGGAFTGTYCGTFNKATDDSGTAVIGAGNNVGNYGTYPTGSGGAFTGTYCGSFNKVASAGGTAVVGLGYGVSSPQTYANGGGGAFAGTVCGGYGVATNTSGLCYGLYGKDSSSVGYGVYGRNNNTSGTGVSGVGNNTSGTYLTAGSGGSFTGTGYGVYGRANNTTGAAGYFENGHGTQVRVAYYSGSTEYKILGDGTVSTIMSTRDGRKALFAPEMPEAYFEDCGEGRLADGHCRVNLERLFSDCIAVDATHPLKVFVQLEDDCKGVYVKKDLTGFDVHELQDGKSDARFSWRVLAKWKGNENVRLPEAPGTEPTVAAERQEATGSRAGVSEIRQSAPVVVGAATPGQRVPDIR